jgi:hypothetical protein
VGRSDFAITKAVVVDKEVYAIPRNLDTRYNGHKLWFRVPNTKPKIFIKQKIRDLQSIINICIYEVD